MKKILFLTLFAVSLGTVAYGNCDYPGCVIGQADRFNANLNAMYGSKSKADLVKNAKLCKKSSKGLHNSMSECNTVSWTFDKDEIAYFPGFFDRIVNWFSE